MEKNIRKFRRTTRRFLSRKQFARASTYSLRTVDTHLKNGTILSLRLPGNRRVLIPASELDRLEELARRGPEGNQELSGPSEVISNPEAKPAEATI